MTYLQRTVKNFYFASDDIFLTKFDSLGNFKWASRAGSDGFDQLNSIATDKYLNIYSTGNFESTANFDTSIVSSIGGDDIFVAKTDSSGKWIWALSGGSESWIEKGNSIAVDSASNVYLTGTFKGLSYFNNLYYIFNFRYWSSLTK